MPLTAQRCVRVVSSWVLQFILTCDDGTGQHLAVQFLRKVRRVHGVTVGGVPGVTCLYPGTTRRHFDLALVWGGPGRFVHRFLYKKMPYTLIKCPCPAAGCTVTTNCCSAALPTTLHATITDPNSDCPCAAAGASITLVYNPATHKWTGTGPFGTCGQNITLSFWCNGSDCNGFLLSASWSDGCAADLPGQIPEPGCSCSPLSVPFSLPVGSACGCTFLIATPQVIITT
jgi:hypothetical protein